MNRNVVSAVGIVAAIAAVAIGVWALAGAASEDSSETASQTGPGNGQMQDGMRPPDGAGYGPPNGGPPGGGQGGPGNMTEATGEEAEKAEAAALDEVDGTVERVFKNEDQDTYMVIVVKSDDSRALVTVSSDFDSAEVQDVPSGGPNGQPPTPPSN